jgi:hypothetical protein
MIELSCIKVSAAEISSLIHASSCHYPDKFVEKLVI